MNQTEVNITRVTLRATIALSILIGIVAWFSYRATHNTFAAGCVVSGALLVYLLLAYFFVPVLRRKKSDRRLFSYRRRSYVTLATIKLFFTPGRMIAIALIDFVAMLAGKRVDHSATKIDVTL